MLLRFHQNIFLILTVFFAAMLSADNLTPSKNLYPVVENNKFGYIDSSGKIVFKPQFEDAAYFSENYGSVKIGGRYKYLSSEGQFLNEDEYDSAAPFIGGCAMVFFKGIQASRHLSIGSKVSFIDHEGKAISKQACCNKQKSYVSKWRSENLDLNLIPYKRDPKKGEITGGSDYWGYKDPRGKIIIEAKFGGASDFYKTGIAVVLDYKTRLRGFINRKGAFVKKPIYLSAYSFKRDLTFVRERDKCGYINKDFAYVWHTPKSFDILDENFKVSPYCEMGD